LFRINTLAAVSTISSSPFFNTPEQRLSLARQRFFEQGERPTGLVSEAVIQSWMRCLQQHQQPERPVVFEPVTASRVHGVLMRNRLLLQVAATEMEQLQRALAGTTAAALLVDAQGVVMHSTWRPGHAETPVMNLAARVGVNLSEAAVGTTAPGVAAHVGRVVKVEGAEHFAHAVHGVQCAAAPVRDASGRLVAVLDLSSEGRSFGFDAAILVERYARGIENRLLCAQSRAGSPDRIVVRLQLDAALLQGPWAGLIGIDEEGRVEWLNGAAAALLGQHSAWAAPAGLTGEALLGLSPAALHAACAAATPQRLRLPSGLGVWSLCRRAGHESFDGPAADGDTAAGGGEPPPDPAAAPIAAPACGPTLHDADHRLVQQTLQACGGNVSQAARRLGVSRGLIYRHLKKRADQASGNPT
jgi:transcriptional regulator of acetoin/glycerol metabolism